MDGPDDEARRKQALTNIARTLGVSLDTFLHDGSETPRDPTADAQEAELLRLFRQIPDARTRRRCLGFLRVLASPPGED